jgi:cbb3-type cytochrome c oxidase subunit II
MKRFENFTSIFLLGSLGCFLLSLFAMGLAPWTTLKRVNQVAAGATNPYYDQNGNLNSVGRGRKIYIKEACWHCHSQFVRPVAGEPYRYGPTSNSWDSMFDIPQTFGTRRIGPDLSREAGRHPNDWHLAHLYNPRYTTPLSVMPSYPWLFENVNGELKPKTTALDLVDYLQYLGKNYEEEVRKIVYPQKYKVSGAPEISQVSLEKGQILFKENCIGCHGDKGDGNGPAAQFMLPKPANLVGRYISNSEVYSILTRGVYGSSMPSFREMPERDLWALATFVSSLGSEVKVKLTATPHEVDKGKKLFVTNCGACHGESGEWRWRRGCRCRFKPATKGFHPPAFF